MCHGSRITTLVAIELLEEGGLAGDLDVVSAPDVTDS
jgi:hypothetical protein